MTRLSPLEVSFFVMESPARPMHGGGVMLFDAPPDGSTSEIVDRVVAAFGATKPVAPWNQRPVFTLGSLPHWETVSDVELGNHVRRIALPAPGSLEQLMELVSHLYQALLDRSRPLWETYVVEGLEHGRWGVFVKAHHSLADGVGGLQMFWCPCRSRCARTAMELREQLPVGRAWVPNVANFILSNISGGPKEARFLGQAKLTSFYATPIVSGSQAANFTLIPYQDLLCMGVGAARNIIPDTARLAALALRSFRDLQASALEATVA
jgi:hypothetical protein